MNLHIIDKIYVSKDFAAYKNNKSQMLTSKYTGNVLCHDHGFINFLGIDSLTFAVLTDINTRAQNNHFEYTIVSFNEINWLKDYIDLLKRVKRNSTEVLEVYEQHLSEMIHMHVGSNFIGVDVMIERPYLLYNAYSRFDGQVYKSIRINNIIEPVKSKMRVLSLIHTAYAKSFIDGLKSVHSKSGNSEVIGLCKPVKRGGKQ